MAMDSGDSVQETVKRKAEDGEREVGEELKDKKNKTRKEEGRGAKRSVDEWEELAKRLKTGAEARAEESKNLGEGMDINQSHVAKEIGAVSMGESDVKFDETVFEFINSTWNEYEEELYYDAILSNLRRAHDQGVGGGSKKSRDGDVQEAWCVREGSGRGVLEGDG